MIGLSYSIFAATTWPCIPYIVKPHVSGTAIGIGFCFQAIGIFVGSYIVGVISVANKGADKVVNYFWVCIFLAVSALIATACMVWYLFYDLRKGGILMSIDPKKAQQIFEEDEEKALKITKTEEN